MTLKQNANNYGEKLSKLVERLPSLDKEDAITDVLTEIEGEFSKRPELIGFALENPALLRTKICFEKKDKLAASTFGHYIVEAYPREALTLFDLLREDPFNYLPVIKAEDYMGYTVACAHLIKIILKDGREAFRKAILEDSGIAGDAPVSDGPFYEGLRGLLIKKLTGHPELESILNIKDPDYNFAQYMVFDDYLGGKLIDLIKDRPFFLSVLELAGKDGIKLFWRLAGPENHETVDMLIDAFESVPVDTVERLLMSKTPTGYNIDLSLANLIVAHRHGAIKLQNLIDRQPKLNSIAAMEGFYKKGARLKIGEIMNLAFRDEAKELMRKASMGGKLGSA